MTPSRPLGHGILVRAAALFAYAVVILAMRKRFDVLVALGLYSVLTLVMTWPVASRLYDVVPGDLGDPLLTTWVLWWNAQVVPFTDRWWNPPVFFPLSDSITLSDHRVGISLITTPLIKFGASPLAASNIAFLLSFVLSATAAYILCFSLTRRRDAALIGGLLFGFHPFRAAHLEHLELLSAYWLPLIFVAAHSWVRSLSTSSLVLLAGALTMQALTSAYYFAFAGVLLGFWLLWFTPRHASLRHYGGAALAIVAPLVIAMLIFVRYSEAHHRLALSRSAAEIEAFSADIIELFRAPALVAIWPTFDWGGGETALMPGLAGVVLIAVACWTRRGVDDSLAATTRTERVRNATLLVAIVMAVAALVPVVIGPIQYRIGRLAISFTHAYKPISVSLVLLCGWLLTGPRVRRAWRTSSPFAFYALATVAMFTLALGPTIRMFGHRIMWQAPYSWLMILPGFRDGFRVPARFAMIGALTLAVAAAIAFSRLFDNTPRRARTAAAALCLMAILGEGWVYPFPVHKAPASLGVPSALAKGSVILELPLGPFEDATAMYHSIFHHHHITNGMSGYVPVHYRVLEVCLREERVEVLRPLAELGDIAIYVHPNSVGERGIYDRLVSRLGATWLPTHEQHRVLLLARRDAVPVQSAGRQRVAIQQLTSDVQPDTAGAMIDGDLDSGWSTESPQRGAETVTADLGSLVEVNAVTLDTTAARAADFPRSPIIETSTDQKDWVEVWRGEACADTLRAALKEPRSVPVQFTFPVTSARYLRIRQVGQSDYPWSVAELSIHH